MPEISHTRPNELRLDVGVHGRASTADNTRANIKLPNTDETHKFFEKIYAAETDTLSIDGKLQAQVLTSPIYPALGLILHHYGDETAELMIDDARTVSDARKRASNLEKSVYVFPSASWLRRIKDADVKDQRENLLEHLVPLSPDMKITTVDRPSDPHTLLNAPKSMEGLTPPE